MNGEERSAILAHLKDAVDHSKTLYETAKMNFEESLRLSQDLGPAHPDGSLARSTKQFWNVVALYQKALHKYNRFLIDGELPDDEPE